MIPLLPAKTPLTPAEYVDHIACMDALAYLRIMPSDSVNCIVTSPPYWGLRNYNVDGQIGLEPTLKEFIDTLVILFREARRVLRSDGTCWINMGDAYASSVNGRSAADTKSAGNDDRTFRDKPFSTIGGNIKPKDLLMQPHRLAIALQDDGWWVRSDIVWAKPNPMPESVTDRPTKSHEYVFLLTKSERYWYDAEAIREPAKDWGERDRTNGKYHNEGTGLHPHTGLTGKLNRGNRKAFRGGGTYTHSGAFSNSDYKPNEVKGNSDEPVIDRNKRDVWTVPTAQSKESHFATFPPKLIEPMILAGCPAGGIVLDPFMGSGTTALVSRELGRHFTGCELNPDYVGIIERRLAVPYTMPMMLEVGTANDNKHLVIETL